MYRFLNLMAKITEFLNKLPKPIQTKFHNYFGKARADASILSFQRVAKNSRVSLPYRVIIDNHLTLNMLETFYEGVFVLLENNDYFDLLEKDDPLSKYLINNIGSENVVSSMICIYSIDGNSGSSESKQILEKMKPIILKNNWIPIERKEGPFSNICQGNHKLTGHYYYDISGGSNVSETSHSFNGEKIPQQFQLFNHFSDYANIKTMEYTKNTLIFYMLHCFDIKKYIPEKMVSELLLSLKPDLTLYNECIIDSVLYCPITNIKISIDFFLKNHSDPNCIHLCHNEAVAKNKIKFNDCILTAFRPDNLFFGTKNGNLQMQDFSIQEYHQEQLLIHFRKLRLKMCEVSTQTETF